MTKPDHYEFGFMSVAAHRKIAATHPDLIFFRSESLDDGSFLLTGCVSSGNYTRGPRKGRPRYDGTPVRVVVTTPEVAEAERAYEAETGKCWRCLGSGEITVGFRVGEGPIRRRCPRCSGRES